MHLNGCNACGQVDINLVNTLHFLQSSIHSFKAAYIQPLAANHTKSSNIALLQSVEIHIRV